MAMMAAHGQAPVVQPFIQKATSASTVQSNTFSATFGNTPGNGRLMILIIGSDGTPNIPVGWTPDINFTNNCSLAICRRVAGASEPTTVTVTTTGNCQTQLAIFELPTYTTVDQGFQDSFFNGDTVETLGPITTLSANEIIFAAASLLSPTGLCAPFTWTNGFIQYVYLTSPVNGTSTDPSELVIAIKVVNSTGTYSTNLTVTHTPDQTSNIAMTSYQ